MHDMHSVRIAFASPRRILFALLERMRVGLLLVIEDIQETDLRSGDRSPVRSISNECFKIKTPYHEYAYQNYAADDVRSDSHVDYGGRLRTFSL